MFIACDVSGQLKCDRYYVLGSAWISKKQLPKYEEAVCNFRLVNKLWGELKWSKVRKKKLLEYQKFLNLSLNKFSIDFKLILIDKKILNMNYFKRNYGKMFSTFFYLLLRSHMPSVSKEIHVFDILIDKEDWMHREGLNLKRYLEKFLINEDLEKKINHLSSCDSKICSVIQICDLIVGAVSAVWNQRFSQISQNKKVFIQHIETLLRYSLTELTLPSAAHFNLWLWRPSAF